MTVPQTLDREFLEWLRSRTEESWANLPQLPSDGWQPGTRWAKPLSEAEISEIENKWGLSFPPDYRLFLNVLHTTDRPPLARKWVGGLMRLIKGSSELVEGVGFHDWRSNDDVVRERLEWPLSGLEFDIDHNALWLNEWGDKPSSVALQKQKLREEFLKAPKVIPVFGHRYLLSDPCEAGNPVLSIYQADIITYGLSLRGYLLNELSSSVRLTNEELEKERDSQTEKISLSRIPFWGPVSGEERASA